MSAMKPISFEFLLKCLVKCLSFQQKDLPFLGEKLAFRAQPKKNCTGIGGEKHN
jgi:hypothetical protein